MICKKNRISYYLCRKSKIQKRAYQDMHVLTKSKLPCVYPGMHAAVNVLSSLAYGKGIMHSIQVSVEKWKVYQYDD